MFLYDVFNMLKSRILIFIILLILFLTSFGIPQQSVQSKNILILFSYSSDGPAYRRILDGIMQELGNEFGDSYSLHTEYLQIELYPPNNYPKQRFDSYNEKYRDIKLDLLICVGVNVINPIKKFAESYLLDLPTVSVDIDFSNYGFNTDLHLNDHTAALGLKFNIEKTFSTALSLFPATSSIYFISGTSPLDHLLTSVTQGVSKTIDKNIKTTFITDLSMDETLKLVSKLPKNSLIFIPYFTTDNKLVRYHNTEAIRFMSRVANAPIFHISDLGAGDGMIGGYVMSFTKVGLLAGKTAVKILNGTDPNSIKINENDYYEYIFDWRELKKWNVENSKLIPEGSTILFRDVSLLEQYKWIIIAVILFIVLQTLLIVNLIRLNRNQKLMTQQIIDSENKYRNFLHQDRLFRIGQITASLSHELNQPLTAILSNAQAGIRFIDSNESNPELLKNIFQNIVFNDKRTSSILRSIRSMMKLETRAKVKVNLNSVIRRVVNIYHSEAKKLQIKFKLNLTDTDIYVLADHVQIEQVLLNLIFNSAQAMEKTEIQNKIITISQYKNENEVIVSVYDKGAGIDKEIMGKIFQPFITSKNEGMGIGLAICQSIIEDHKGKIRAANLPEGGAEISFSLGILSNE